MAPACSCHSFWRISRIYGPAGCYHHAARGGADWGHFSAGRKWCDQYNPRLFLVLGFLLAAASPIGFHGGANRGEDAGLGAARARTRVCLPPLVMLGLRTLAREEISAACLVNITRQIAGMGGIALAGVLLERWHYVHHLTGAEHLATSTAGVEQVQRTLAGILQEGGDLGELLHTKVQAALSQYLTQESLVVAFRIAMSFTVVFVAAALASVCIPGGEEKQ